MHPFDRLRQTRLMPFVLEFGLVAIACLLVRPGHILLPFIWAAVTAYLLFPVVTRLERRLRLPRVAAIGVVYVVLIGFLVIAGFQIVPLAVNQVRSLATELPNLITNDREELVKEPEIRYAGFVVEPARWMLVFTSLLSRSPSASDGKPCCSCCIRLNC